MTDAPPTEKKPHSKRIYVMWGVALALLLALGLFSWLVVVPIMEVDQALDVHPDERSVESVLDDLGGREEAARKIGLWLRLPYTEKDYRGKATWMLSHCGAAGVPGLSRALTDRSAEVRYGAAVGLGRVGQASAEAVEALIAALGDTDAAVRGEAARALSRIGPPAEIALPALEKAAEDRDASVREAAAEALKKIKAAQEKKK